MSDGLGILLTLMAVFAPLALAWFLCFKYLEPPSQSHKRKK